MRIGVPRERLANEARVAATPKTVEQLLKLGFTVAIERGAGKLASFEDVAYEAAGAALVDESEVWQSDLILKVNAPQDDEIALMREGSTLVSFIWPAQNPELMAAGGAQRHRAGDGLGTAHLARPIDGCAELDGQHRRLPRDRRSGA